jgi:hypothetical protein
MLSLLGIKMMKIENWGSDRANLKKIVLECYGEKDSLLSLFFMV